jgi:hypothetical protein
MFEIWWPPSFFDLMTHLIIHLVDELEICGPIATRWCYPIESYLYILKKYVRNKAKPKACMASGYMYDKTLGFCIKYFALYPHTRHHIWNAIEEEPNCWGSLGWKWKIEKVVSSGDGGIHEHVITNSMVTETPCMHHANPCVYCCILAESSILPNVELVEVVFLGFFS